MVLVDTSVWVEHFRSRDSDLVARLETGEVLVHEFVQGELALGGRIKRRDEIVGLLGMLPQTPRATHAEVQHLVSHHRLAGSGIGWVDAHLVAAALLAGAGLWTLDQRLARVAGKLSVAAR